MEGSKELSLRKKRWEKKREGTREKTASSSKLDVSLAAGGKDRTSLSHRRVGSVEMMPPSLHEKKRVTHPLFIPDLKNRDPVIYSSLASTFFLAGVFFCSRDDETRRREEQEQNSSHTHKPFASTHLHADVADMLLFSCFSTPAHEISVDEKRGRRDEKSRWSEKKRERIPYSLLLF